MPIALGGGVILPISVNGGAPAPFAFDTGATITALDSAFAETNGLRAAAGGGKAVGIKGGAAPLGLLHDLSLTCAGTKLPAQDAGIIDLPNHIADRGARPRLAGILGLNAFGDQPMRLDIANRRLSLLAPGAASDPLGIPVSLSTTVRFVPTDAAAPRYTRAMMTATLDGLYQPALTLTHRTRRQKKVLF